MLLLCAQHPLFAFGLAIVAWLVVLGLLPLPKGAHIMADQISTPDPNPSVFPTPVVEALSALQSAQDVAHAAVGSQAATAAALADAQKSDDDAKAAMAAAFVDRASKYAALAAVIQSVYQSPTP